MKARLTAKGRALITAIEAGLIPETEQGYDDTAFKKFWDVFEKETLSQYYVEKHPPQMFGDWKEKLWWIPWVISIIALIRALL